MWEGFDEYAHFGYVQYIASGRGWLVFPDTRASREVERSLALVPMPWTSRFDPPPHETHEWYWQLPVELRTRREGELASLPHGADAQEPAVSVPIESQQPPLNYWLMAAVYRLVTGLSLPARVGVLRLLNLLFASAAVPAAWWAARLVFRTGIEGASKLRDAADVAEATAAVVALMPEMLFDAARVANSGLATALFSLLAVLCLELVDARRQAALWIGVVLGLGLLTKAFFLTSVPAVTAVLAWCVWKRRVRLLPATSTMAIAVAISGWWYVRNLRITGSLSGVLQDAALRPVSLVARLRHLGEVRWLSALDSTFFSHICLGGWSLLQLRAWIYHFFAVVALLAAAGLAVAWSRRNPQRRHIGAMAAIYFFFCAGLAYHVLLTFLANGISSTAGWYLCAVVVPETVLAAAGLRALSPPHSWRYAMGGAALAFGLLDLYGMVFVAVPYYAGVIGHKPNGFLEAFHWSALARTGAAEALRRIAIDKPAYVSPEVIVAAFCAYLIATAILPTLALTGGKHEEITGRPPSGGSHWARMLF